MLSADLDSQDNKRDASGLVAQDVLLSKGMTATNGTKALHISRSTLPLDSQNSLELDCDDLEGSTPTLSETCSSGQKHDVSSADNELTTSQREEDRRQKLRERKRVQRLNQDFAERERLRARGRIKALRQDPYFRQLERQRDKERRRKARLLNQNQRLQERERDKIHKSFMRSLETGGNMIPPTNATDNEVGGATVDVNTSIETADSDRNVSPSSPPH